MDDFDAFELRQEQITQLENIEINLLNQSFQINSDDDQEVIQPLERRCRRVIMSGSEDEDDGILRAIADTIGKYLIKCCLLPIHSK